MSFTNILCLRQRKYQQDNARPITCLNLTVIYKYVFSRTFSLGQELVDGKSFLFRSDSPLNTYRIIFPNRVSGSILIVSHTDLIIYLEKTDLLKLTSLGLFRTGFQGETELDVTSGFKLKMRKIQPPDPNFSLSLSFNRLIKG